MLVSALEPLGKQDNLGAEVHSFVGECIERLRSNTLIPPILKPSLEGRIKQLRDESVRQALHRLARRILPDRPDALGIIDKAYTLRSQIIHEGRPDDLDVDLELEGRKISELIRDIYARILNQ
jgi:hypothetical protein